MGLGRKGEELFCYALKVARDAERKARREAQKRYSEKVKREKAEWRTAILNEIYRQEAATHSEVEAAAFAPIRKQRILEHLEREKALFAGKYHVTMVDDGGALRYEAIAHED